VYTGTPHRYTDYSFLVNGLTADGTQGKGGGTKLVSNAYQAFTITDMAQDIVNVNTRSKKLECPSGTKLVCYSTGYSAATVVVNQGNNGTIAWGATQDTTLGRAAAGVSSFNGTIALGQASVQALANNSTITVFKSVAVGSVPVTTTGPVTGVILQPGSINGQEASVINRSSNSITFAASGTSNVADGVNCVIPPLTTRRFLWDRGTSLWYSIR
jgi:hypothetical protein